MKAIRKLQERVVPSVVKEYFWKRYLTSPNHSARAIGDVNAEWRSRIDCVLDCPDNAHIQRVPEAGKIKDYYVVMHNGVKVCANGYYGSGIANMLMENRGVHEPQEERAFQEIVDLMPEKCNMLELGAYWGFYSLSLLSARPAARCILVEPEPFNILSGQLNFELNGCQGEFIQAIVGREAKRKKAVSVDQLMRDRKIEHLHILHSDIQGFEAAMLEGASESLRKGLVDYIFISTHSNELHETCADKLRRFDFDILASANMDESYSYDGLIVARRASLSGPRSLSISKRSNARRAA
jgi:hypothetical protein